MFDQKRFSKTYYSVVNQRVGDPTLCAVRRKGLMVFAEIIILRNSPQLDRFFTYKIPEKFENAVQIGDRVMVPFGRADHLEGIIFKLFDQIDLPKEYEIKAIDFRFNDGIHLNEKDLLLVGYLKDTYLCSYSEACQLLLPSNTMTIHYKTYTKVKSSFNFDERLKKSEHAVLNVFKDKPLKIEDIDLPYAKSTIKNALSKCVALGLLEVNDYFESVVKDRYEECLEKTDKLLKEIDQIPKRNKAQIKLANYLMEHASGERKAVQEFLKISKNVVDGFIEKGWIHLTLKEIKRMPEFMSSVYDKSQVVLNASQATVYRKIIEDFDHHVSNDFLIHGVTGSGKTEIYAELIETFIKRGKKAMLLVPEIALTPQIVARFVSRFGRERIALIHSKISPGEKHDQWQGIKYGKYDIVIGARSAIFTPCDNLGVIIIDESHEQSYRSEKRPKYNTYDVAKYKANQNGALIVSGTATPSVEAYFDALNESVTLLPLDSRYNKKKVPKIEIVDMREELARGNKSILSERLHQAIQKRLDLKEQVLIFLNRKGHSTFVTCRACGFTLACPHCDVTMTFFKGAKSVKCNYCAYESFVPKKCPACNSGYFKYFGVGTEKVEEQLSELFPGARIDRMDRTTTTKKGSVEKIIGAVEAEKTDILVGTQMITKGLDFKKVSLVGILSADLMLNLPHYGAAERAYQLFHQVAGRAGRAEIEGEVILQTYVPEHYAINQESYVSFYEEEIKFREAMRYPPFTKMINLIFTSVDEQTARNFAQKSEAYIKDRILKKDLQSMIEVYGANPALLKKVDGQYRWQILLKIDPIAYDEVKNWLRKLDLRFHTIDKCRMNIDLDAINIL